MKKVTKNRRKAKKFFEQMDTESPVMIGSLESIREIGKQALDECSRQLGCVFAEVIMSLDRESLAGREYHPSGEYQKWGWQNGSIYMGQEKIKLKHPRLRDSRGEVLLPSYERLKHPGVFSEEVLLRALRGMSGRKYRETLTGLSEEFGVSPSSISNRLIEASSAKLKELRERTLSEFQLFALFLDTVHRGGIAFVAALGIDKKGQKKILGFWEGATENKELAKSLLSDMESRGLVMTQEILFITDGGKGIISALKERFGKHLLHQRCTIHKDRNIQKHLPEKYRKEAHRRFTNAIAMVSHQEAQKGLKDLELWLSRINESAVLSLQEAKEELLTVHRLKVPALLRKTLHSTNPIESMFSSVRFGEHNIKRYRNSKMSQRWLASICLYAEETFRTIKGFKEISEVLYQIKLFQNKTPLKRAG